MRVISKTLTLPLAALSATLILALPALAAADGAHESEPDFGHPGNAAKANRSIDIIAVDLAFKPDSVTVKRGQTVKFVVTDKGKLTHKRTERTGVKRTGVTSELGRVENRLPAP